MVCVLRFVVVVNIFLPTYFLLQVVQVTSHVHADSSCLLVAKERMLILKYDEIRSRSCKGSQKQQPA